MSGAKIFIRGARRYIGYASGGHHPNGPEETAHEYCAMMLLHGDEGNTENFLGAQVTDAPKGVFLVGDVVLNEYFDDGTIDIGLSMKNSSQTVYELLLWFSIELRLDAIRLSNASSSRLKLH